MAADIYGDLRHGGDLYHAMFEGGAFLVCALVIAAQLFSYLRRQQAESLEVHAKVRDLTAERDQWRSRSEHFLQGLGRAIDEQFIRWSLSNSEREIALLILKGFSHKEIAQIRDTSERTVRQQAAAVYAKAGLENKSQLSAFFLEDLALPVVEGKNGAMP